MNKWQNTMLVLAITAILAGCDEETIVVSDDTNGKELPDFQRPTSNITLAAAWDADSDPHGIKITPDNVGKQSPAKFIEHDFATPVGRTSSFDGSEAFSFDYDSMLSADAVMLSEQRAVSFWFKLDQQQSSGQILSIMDGSHWGARGREPFLMYDPDSESLSLWRKYHGSTFPGDTPPVNLIDGVTIERDQWYHIVITSSLDHSKIFLNGELTAAGEPIGVASHAVHFGRSVPSNNSPYPDVASAQMAIDNIRIYQNDISGRYVEAIYNSENGLDPAPLPAFNPTPSNGTLNTRLEQFELKWDMLSEPSPLQDVTFNINLSDTADFANILAQYSTEENSIVPDGLEPDKQYFWRVDTVAEDNVIEGETWTFSTEKKLDTSTVPEIINVMAYNIWWGGAAPAGSRSQEYIYEQIITNDIDILFMQESYGYQQTLAQKLGFNLWPENDSSDQNITVLTRFPIVEELRVDGNFVGVRLDLGEGKEIDAYSAWLPYGDDTVNSAANPEVTNQQLTTIDSEAGYPTVKGALPEILSEADDQRPIIIGGDYNTISHLDYTDNSNRYGRGQLDLPTSQEFQDQGFIDSYREVYPDETKDTCFSWTPFFKANPGQGRIDFIHYKGNQLSAVDAKCLLNDGHQEFHPSDHGAVISQFKVNKGNW